MLPKIKMLLAAPCLAICGTRKLVESATDSSDENVESVEETPTVGLEPTTTRLRALRSTD